MADAPAIPDGFVGVTRAEFFARLGADKRDIMPSLDARDHKVWRVVATREAWGWTAPGWANPMAHARLYAIKATEVRHG